MQIFALIIGLLILTAALAFVSLPFRQGSRKGDVLAPKTVVTQDGRRESIFAALRDLDFDFRTGKVSEEDYQPLRAQLTIEAAQYIESEKNKDEQLEALIQTRRKAKSQGVTCEQCGAPMKAGQQFCSKCGSTAKSTSCPSCGKKMHASDLFCSSCGTKVEAQMDAVTQS